MDYSDGVLFGTQDVLDLISDGYIQIALPKYATNTQRNVQLDLRKNDQKASFYIHQCVDMNMF